MAEVVIRQARLEDIPALLDLQHLCYPVLSTVAVWRDDHLRSHIERFPEGQLVAETSEGIIGQSASFRIASKLALGPHTFSGITARGTFANHDPDGDALYGAEIMVHPDHRRRGIARRFYKARFEIIRRLGLRFFIAGGRIPEYATHSLAMSAEEYVQAVVDGKLEDRVLTPQLRAGLRVERVVPDYLSDPRSRNFATLLVWENPEAAASKPRRRSVSKRTAAPMVRR